MAASKSKLNDLLRHRWAAWGGIIVTFLVAFLTLIPAVDEYSVLQERSAEAERALDQAYREQQWLPKLKAKHAELQQQLQVQRRKEMDEEAAHRLRETLVQIARDTNCHVRRVDLGPARVRQWYENDHPTTVVATARRGKKTSFELKVHELRLTLTGKNNDIQQMLRKIEDLQVQLNVQQLTIKSTDSNGQQLQLEISMQLFAIARAKSDKAS